MTGKGWLRAGGPLSSALFGLSLALAVSAGLGACAAAPTEVVRNTQPAPSATLPQVEASEAASTATQPLPSPTPPTPTVVAQAPPSPTTIPPAATASATATAATPTPRPSATAELGATASPSPTASSAATTGPCRLGLGLREETGPIVIQYAGEAGLVMASSAGLAEHYFPQLDGWIRVLGAPSLDDLTQRAEAAAARGLAYEALGYGLETSQTTPEEEWQDVVGSTQEARAIADRYGKLLVMGPGFRLMSENSEHYPEMAALADVWLLQTQRLQASPPGPEYRHEVEQVVAQIRAGNPDILIWAQITLLPDRPPDAQEWLAYHESIADLVDGATYVGAYTWDTADAGQLVSTIETIFAAVCSGGQ